MCAAPTAHRQILPPGRSSFELRPTFAFVIAGCLAALLAGCAPPRRRQIAVIPRTAGLRLWDGLLIGADSAARAQDCGIYFNAPSREDDVQGQIDLVDRVVAEGYAGLILSPNQSLALMAPVRGALARKIPVVILGSALPLPAGNGLSYVLNDDETGGRLAARRVALLLRGKGSVAVIGIDPNIAGVMIRTRSLETELATLEPGVSVVVQRAGGFNVPQEQQAAEEVLRANPSLDIIVAVTSAATRGAYLALTANNAAGRIKLIGFDQDSVGSAGNRRSRLRCRGEHLRNGTGGGPPHRRPLERRTDARRPQA